MDYRTIVCDTNFSVCPKVDGVVLHQQRGSAIVMLFVAVALFGLLAFAFLQGSRSNLSFLGNETTKAATYRGQDCTNAVDLAVKRLSSRGCEGMISLNPDGSNASPGAPADGSCSVYHPNGGGVALCNVAAAPVVPPCAVVNIGEECPDGSIYAGMSPDGNRRMYTTPANGPSLPWNNGNNTGEVATGAISLVTGYANTMTILALDANSDTPEFEFHLAAQYCADLVVHQHDDWYLPGQSEMEVLGDGQQEIGGFVSGPGGVYQGAWENAASWLQHMHIWGAGNGEYALTGGSPKYESHIVRCVRKD